MFRIFKCKEDCCFVSTDFQHDMDNWRLVFFNLNTKFWLFYLYENCDHLPLPKISFIYLLIRTFENIFYTIFVGNEDPLLVFSAGMQPKIGRGQKFFQREFQKISGFLALSLRKLVNFWKILFYFFDLRKFYAFRRCIGFAFFLRFLIPIPIENNLGIL